MFKIKICKAPLATVASASIGLMLALALPQQAWAVPSYARQTGLACEACHTVFPQLTPFGRVFKASGYTLSNTSKVQDVDSLKHYLMSLSDTPPVSIMAIGSTSSTAKAADRSQAGRLRIFPSSSVCSMPDPFPTM